jgi:hypothetical protein
MKKTIVSNKNHNVKYLFLMAVSMSASVQAAQSAAKPVRVAHTLPALVVIQPFIVVPLASPHLQASPAAAAALTAQRPVGEKSSFLMCLAMCCDLFSCQTKVSDDDGTDEMRQCCCGYYLATRTSNNNDALCCGRRCVPQGSPMSGSSGSDSDSDGE